MDRPRASIVSGHMSRLPAVLVLCACVLSQEADAPEDPEQRAIERVLSEPAPAPAPAHAPAPAPEADPPVASRPAFAWLADLPPRAGALDEADVRAEAVFARFVGALSSGDTDAWRRVALELVRDAPTSPRIPYVYLAFAEASLDTGRPDQAIAFLDRVLTFSDPYARMFAFHDLGWAHMQTDPPDHAKALAAFASAIQESQRDELRSPASARALRTAARRDLVRPYAVVGRPDRARDFFARVGRGPADEDMVDEMLSLLAATPR
jgi:tetratricopeptide (TPR) repeat protein